jgi:K+ transporter
MHKNTCEQNPNYKPFNIDTRTIAGRTGAGTIKVSCFTVVLPCIAIDFFLNNQKGALIMKSFGIKHYMFRASSLPIIRTFLL